MSDEKTVAGTAAAEHTKETLIEAGEVALDELMGDGFDEEEAKELVVKTLDGILAWKLFFTGPLGDALEANDGPAIEKALEVVLPIIKQLCIPDPTKIDERATRAASRGWHKMAARRTARAERVRARQAAKDAE